MANSKQIVYLSQSQYAELIANGTITVDGVTVTYDENDIYVTPQAEPVTDVRINGTSIAANGVANIPASGYGTYGVVKLHTNVGNDGLRFSDGNLGIYPAFGSDMKQGRQNGRPITPSTQDAATFYGLAKAAGHDEKDSTESLGTYTPEAKGAIQQMLGISDLIATAENDLVASKAYKVGDIFTANGKLYKATAAIAADVAIVLQNEGETISGANAVETKVGEGFVKFTDYATNSQAGVVKANYQQGIGITSNGELQISIASDTEMKSGSNGLRRPITPSNQEKATFYGLAKAAGADEKDSTLPVGQYTDAAKSAIRSMIGATSSNVIAVQDTQPTDTDTKIWLPETAETPVEVPTVTEMEQALAGKVGFEDYASTTTGGVVKVNLNNGTQIINGVITTVNASDAEIKSGASGYKMLSATNQHKATFYGLAKAAGDTTQSASDNAVGTYTDEAKAAIRTMLGAVGAEDYATNNGAAGLVKIAGNGLIISSQGEGLLLINAATAAQVKTGASAYFPIVPSNQHTAAFYGLAKASGDTTQSASSNAVGVYTDNAKASIKSMLGIQDGSTGTVNVSGTAPTIAAVENTRYVCGEVTSLSFTPPASGISIVRFTSGSSVTVLTIPSTVKFPEWFDPTALETNTIYEICVTDGEFGAVMSWAL